MEGVITLRRLDDTVSYEKFPVRYGTLPSDFYEWYARTYVRKYVGKEIREMYVQYLYRTVRICPVYMVHQIRYRYVLVPYHIFYVNCSHFLLWEILRYGTVSAYYRNKNIRARNRSQLVEYQLRNTSTSFLRQIITSDY